MLVLMPAVRGATLGYRLIEQIRARPGCVPSFIKQNAQSMSMNDGADSSTEILPWYPAGFTESSEASCLYDG
jgi:hypothetical protein